MDVEQSGVAPLEAAPGLASAPTSTVKSDPSLGSKVNVTGQAPLPVPLVPTPPPLAWHCMNTVACMGAPNQSNSPQSSAPGLGGRTPHTPTHSQHSPEESPMISIANHVSLVLDLT